MKIFTKKTLTLLAIVMVGTTLFGQELLWGGPGDANGEFDGGLNDWTVNAVVQPLALWTWQEDASANEGAFSGGGTPVASPSVSNGAAVFDSDFYDNGGDPDDLGMGPAPSPHTCELISPVIDLTGENMVTLEFYQAYRNFQSTTSVVWSNDGGTTWQDTIVINEEALTNQSPLNNKKVVHMIGAGGTDQFRFKFVFDGDYYFWVIDDVSIIRRPEFDLSLGDFFYPASSYQQPVSQIADDTMGFFVDLSNYGRTAQTNISVVAQVLDGSSVLFEDEFVVPELGPETLDSTIELTELFAPELTQGNYDIRYTVSTDQTDYTPNDNTTGANFRASPGRYSKEDGNGDYEAAFQPGGDYFVGNLYRTSNDWVDQFVVTQVTFAAAYNGDNATGNIVNLYLSKVNDNVDAGFDNFDDTEMDLLGHPDLTLRGVATHTYGNEGSFDLISLPIEDFEFDAPGVVLDAGSRYFLFAAYEGDASSMFQVFNQRIDYFQISTVVLSDDWFFGGFGVENAALIRMDIDLYTTTDEKPLPDESLTVFPNPVSDQLNIGISLEEPSLVNVTIANLDGKVLNIDEIKNIDETNRQYDVSNFAPGTYLVRLATENGTKTKKFIKVQ